MIIFHDYGSAGNAGVLVNSFFKFMPEDGDKLIKILHKDWAFKTKRVYRLFGYFDSWPLSNVFKFIEICFVCLWILCVSFIGLCLTLKRPTVIINIYQPFRFYYLLMKFNIFANSLPIIHDVITHKNKLPKIIQVDIQDFVRDFECIILSEHSEKDFLTYSPKHKYYVLPFPLYEFNNYVGVAKSSISPSSNLRNETHKIRVGFLGHLRFEKGIDIILEALKHQEFGNLEVIIAGGNYIDLTIVESDYPSVKFSLDFVSTERYFELFGSLDYCLLLYDSSVSNSGILYDALYFNATPIVSKSPIFIENHFMNSFFFVDNSFELRELLRSLDLQQVRKEQADLCELKDEYICHSKLIYKNFYEEIQ
ncbi:hypothetical protein OAQ69_04215 [Gammaproteobacteria bacterium]|nr:hypothetical protein [Gammaproteobacteria bacterium]